MTFDMQREEANERKKLGELQAKLEDIKIKDVALKANKLSKQGSTSKSKINQQASTSKPKASKQVHERVETTSSSSESENDDDQYEKVDDVALFMKRYHKGLKKQGYRVVKRSFPNKKKRACYNCEAPITLLPSVHMRSRTTNTRRTRKRRRPTVERARSTWERLILGMNGTQLKKTQVKRMRRFQLLLFISHPLHQGSSTTCPMMTTTPLTFVLWQRVRR